MKNNMTIKGWKVSELLMGLYIAAVLVGMPLFVTNAYYNINVDKYYYYCGACALLIPVLILKVLERPSVKEFLKGLSLAEKALVVYWAIAGVSTLLSDYLYESFWGNEGRFSGLFLMTMMSIMGRKRETIFAVPPVRVHTTMAFAFTSRASRHAEWESASERSRMR